MGHILVFRSILEIFLLVQNGLRVTSDSEQRGDRCAVHSGRVHDLHLAGLCLDADEHQQHDEKQNGRNEEDNASSFDSVRVRPLDVLPDDV